MTRRRSAFNRCPPNRAPRAAACRSPPPAYPSRQTPIAPWSARPSASSPRTWCHPGTSWCPRRRAHPRPARPPTTAMRCAGAESRASARVRYQGGVSRGAVGRSRRAEARVCARVIRCTRGTALVFPGDAREGSPREDTSASGHANAICTPHQRHLGGGPHAAHGRASRRTPRAVRQERASQRERQRQASCHRRAGLQAARLSERGCLWLLYGGAMRRLERLRMSHARNAGGVRQWRGRGRSERRARPPASTAHA